MIACGNSAKYQPENAEVLEEEEEEGEQSSEQQAVGNGHIQEDDDDADDEAEVTDIREESAEAENDENIAKIDKQTVEGEPEHNDQNETEEDNNENSEVNQEPSALEDHTNLEVHVENDASTILTNEEDNAKPNDGKIMIIISIHTECLRKKKFLSRRCVIF